MPIVICKLPRAGLGNRLFPLMKAYTFAHLNKLPVIVTNYHQIKVGPWLRREKNKRNYKRFFNFEKNVIASQFDIWKIKKIGRKGLIIEPEVKRFTSENELGSSYMFHEIPHYTKRFEGLSEHRQIVIERLYGLIRPEVRNKINSLEPPFIGVHIRMGDFRKLKDGEKFGTAGTVRTPEDYFIETIKSIRSLHGSELPVKVFTDGNKKELVKLFKMNNVDLVEGNNDLVDLLLLSKSKIIATSAGSTFSYWAAFISAAVVIMHPDFAAIKIRPENVWDQLYEGPFDETNDQFVKAITSIDFPINNEKMI